MPALTILFRLIVVSLLVSCSLSTVAADIISKNDLDAQKEFLQLKIDSSKESQQKDIDGLNKRVEGVDKRVDDQVSRVADIGNQVDRFGICITVLLFLAGVFGYFSAANKAREEAREATKQWLEKHFQTLQQKIKSLEESAALAQTRIDSTVDGVNAHATAAKEYIQRNLDSTNNSIGQISRSDDEALQQSAEQIRSTPEANYSFEDWDTRAFAAYRAEQLEDAALFWKRAATVPGAGAVRTAQALHNRSVVLRQLRRWNDAKTTLEELIASYGNDPSPELQLIMSKALLGLGVTFSNLQDDNAAIAAYDKLISLHDDGESPALREQIAKAMFNKGLKLGQMGLADEEITTYENLLSRYAADNSAALREPIANALLNKGFTLGQIQRSEDAIAAYDQLITLYNNDDSPAIRVQVVKATVNKGIQLGQMQRNDEAVSIFEHLITRYGNDASPDLQEPIAHALNGRGFFRLLEAKKNWTKQEDRANLLSQAETELQRALTGIPGWGTALGNLAYVQWLQGKTLETEQNFRAALVATVSGGETLYRATLDDIAQYTTPEDDGFRKLVERLWEEYQTQQPTKD